MRQGGRSVVSGESQGARILSKDVGSSSVRAELYDDSGDNLQGTEVKLDYDFEYTAHGGATSDADELFELVVQAVDGALSAAGDAEISGVAMSTFWHSVLGLDEAGRPTSPILTWADRRAAGSVPEFLDRMDERAYHRRTGCVPHSSYWPAKLLWAVSAMPEAFGKTARWVSPADYFHTRLFGEPYQVGTSMASGTGLLDQNRQQWDHQTLEVMPIHETQLSEISDEPRKGLTGEWADRWPALRDVPWVPAAGDGAVSDGGNLIEWLRNTLRLPDPEETERLLSAMEPDSHGITFLPLLAGERGPGWADQANGTIAGLSMSNTPVEILRAAMEAVAFRFAIIAEIIETASPGEKEVVASGGGLLHSPTWTRIMADTLGRPVTLSGVKEASSRGAALIALEALGGPEIEAAQAPLGETFEPDPERHEIYRKALERQRRLYDSVLGGS